MSEGAASQLSVEKYKSSDLGEGIRFLKTPNLRPQEKLIISYKIIECDSNNIRYIR